MDDDDQAETEERSVLQDDCHQDPPDVQVTADLLGFLTRRGVQIHHFVPRYQIRFFKLLVVLIDYYSLDLQDLLSLFNPEHE